MIFEGCHPTSLFFLGGGIESRQMSSHLVFGEPLYLYISNEPLHIKDLLLSLLPYRPLPPGHLCDCLSAVGNAMHNFGICTKIAQFKHWWQVITCYILYTIPVSLLLKDLMWYEQYVYGLFFMGILEFGGDSIKSSLA